MGGEANDGRTRPATADRPKLRVIAGGRATARPRRKLTAWHCPACRDAGMVSSLIEPVWQSPVAADGRVRVSTAIKRHVCTHCKMRGVLTFVD